MDLKEWMMDHKFYLLAAVLLVAGGFYYYYVYQPEAAPKSQQISTVETSSAASKIAAKQAEQKKQPEKIKTVMVDVKGEVRHPGVYRANDSDRVNDVIKRAGGITAKADESQVNFAAHVQDEMLIYIPAKGQAEAGVTPPAAVTATVPSSANGNGTTNGKININQAAQSELENLPGIGPAKAEAIIQYRTENGPFQAAEDLKKISGIGEKTFEKLKDSISVQ